MKKNGFTLIELLAVIIVLAIVALVATPIVLNVVDDAKKTAAKAEANLVYTSINDHCKAGVVLKGTTEFASSGYVDCSVAANLTEANIKKNMVTTDATIKNVTINSNGTVKTLTVEADGYTYVFDSTSNAMVLSGAAS